MVIPQLPVVAPTAPILQMPNQDPNMMPQLLGVVGQALSAWGSQGKDKKSSGTSYDKDADLRATIEKAEAMNGYVNSVTSGAQGVPPMTCVICGTATAQNPKYERCNNRNGYFEDYLNAPKSPGVRLLKSHTPAEATMTCIAETQRSFSTNRYHYCTQGGGGYGQNVARPCASENMVKTVASAYELTAGCLAGYIDPGADSNPEAKASIGRAMFQLMNHESGWNLNAVSGTSAGGMGQLTQSAIQHINREEFGKIQARIQGSSDKSCKQLAQTNYQPMQGGLSNACERVSMANGNPQLNMMYTMAHMKLVRDQVEGHIERMGLAPGVRTQLIDQMMVWGHNVGSGGMGQILAAGLRRHGADLRSENVGGFLQKLRQDTYQWHQVKGGRAPGEPTNFLSATQYRLGQLEKRLNGKCGILK